jgi:hypothetical protein
MYMYGKAPTKASLSSSFTPARVGLLERQKQLLRDRRRPFYQPLQHEVGNQPPLLGGLQASDKGITMGSGTTSRIAVGHDFSRVTILPKHEPAGRGFLGDVDGGEPVPDLEADLDRIGDGQLDAGPAAPDAGPAPAPAPVPALAPGPAAPAALAIVSRTAVHAPDGTTDARTKIGVCETVAFTIGGPAPAPAPAQAPAQAPAPLAPAPGPAAPVANWTADNGWPSARSGQASFSWAAPETPGMSRITATIPATGQTSSLVMDVVAPARIRYHRRSVLAIHPPGSAGAGMLLQVFVDPQDVNFGWVELAEDPGPAADVTGYFAARAAAGVDLSHIPNPDFIRLSFNNNTLSRDPASGLARFDAAATAPGLLPPPWSRGTFRWDIPNRYRCVNNPTGAGHVFAHTQQRFFISGGPRPPAGTVTVSKDGQSVRRSP